MPRADVYKYIYKHEELAAVRRAEADGCSLVAAAHAAVAGRASRVSFVPSDMPRPDEVDDYPWSKDDCMDVDRVRWSARRVCHPHYGADVIVLTAAPTSIGLWA